MQIISIEVVHNGYIVQELQKQGDGVSTKPMPSSPPRVFANFADAKFWMEGKLDPLIGES
jgi:hypothetical protein